MLPRMFNHLRLLLVLTPDSRAHPNKISVNHVDQFKAATVSPPPSSPLLSSASLSLSFSFANEFNELFSFHPTTSPVTIILFY